MMTDRSDGILSWFFKGVLILGFAVLAGRLAELQIIKGAYFRELAEGNRIRRVPIPAGRGEIHARGGEILVANIKDTKRLKFSSQSGFETVDVDDEVQGLDVITLFRREYKLADSFAHVSGYLGEVNEEEVGKVNEDCPEKGVMIGGMWVGRVGIEKEYECVLAGAYGEELFEVDSSGNLVRSLGNKPPKQGETLITNIDFGLQEKVAQVMRDKNGAVIVSDINGEVLALFSSPSFDPNLFINKDSIKISKLLEAKDTPFFNRVIGGAYHPGSVFKPIVAVAALVENKIDKDFIYEDTGQIIVKTPQGDFSYSNWFFTQYGGVEGRIGITRAIARSTDTFFYKIGEMLGPDKIAEWAMKFGLGIRSGIDLPGEVEGLVPTPIWKREVKGENWFLGNTYHYSIGQGDLAVTPLSINAATGAIANGRLCKPKIVGESECEDLKIDENYLEEVREGMIGACSQGGTASAFFEWNANSQNGKVACKTGTAQTGVNDKTHAWFTIVAPAFSENPDSSEPQIVMTILVEEGGEGSVVAAPIAKEILDYWFNRNI